MLFCLLIRSKIALRVSYKSSHISFAVLWAAWSHSILHSVIFRLCFWKWSLSLNIQLRMALKSMDTREIMYACSAIHLGPMPRFVFKFIRISVDWKYWKRYENESVDGKHFIRFRNKNSVFKFIRVSVDGTIEALSMSRGPVLGRLWIKRPWGRECVCTLSASFPVAAFLWSATVFWKKARQVLARSTASSKELIDPTMRIGKNALSTTVFYAGRTLKLKTIKPSLTLITNLNQKRGHRCWLEYIISTPPRHIFHCIGQLNIFTRLSQINLQSMNLS